MEPPLLWQNIMKFNKFQQISVNKYIFLLFFDDLWPILVNLENVGKVKTSTDSKEWEDRSCYLM